MDIIISQNSDTPFYQQIYDCLSSRILRGELGPGTCLPPIRTVASSLRVSVITVKRAWEELERDGLIYTVTGKGCFVAELGGRDICDKKDLKITEQLQKDLRYYRELGLSCSELVELIKKLY